MTSLAPWFAVLVALLAVMVNIFMFYQTRRDRSRKDYDDRLDALSKDIVALSKSILSTRQEIGNDVAVQISEVKRTTVSIESCERCDEKNKVHYENLLRAFDDRMSRSEARITDKFEQSIEAVMQKYDRLFKRLIMSVPLHDEKQRAALIEDV